MEGVDCYYAVGLVGEEAAGVVYVDDAGAGEDAIALGAGIDGYGLVFPMVEILGCCMAPMLVPGYNIGWVV